MSQVGAHQSRRRGSDAIGRRGLRRFRPAVTALEGRALLATWTVNSTADGNSPGTLRWAIGQANANNQADTIEFSDAFNTPKTITLTGGVLLLTDTSTTTIEGPGAALLTVNGNKYGGVFEVFD